MTRVKRPLDKAAIRAANKALEKETGGRKLTMSRKDAALRKKWVAAYEKAVGEDAGEPKDEKKTDATAEPCPNNKYITVIFFRKPRNNPPDYWPTDELCYANERFRLKHPGGEEKGKLAINGGVTVTDIPAGSCSFECPEFYTEIEDWITERLQ